MKAVQLALALLVCSFSADASHARNGAITLPEARVKQAAHQTQSKSFQYSEQIDIVEKTTSIRGGAAGISAKAIYGVAVMGAIEAGLKKFFAATGINFPSQLGGCMALFVVAVAAQSIHPGWGDAIQEFLTPGCDILNKWLPAFFVPGLAMLPLAPSIGSGLEVAKFLSVVALGLAYSLATISFAVLALRTAQGAKNEAPAVVAPKKKRGAAPAAPAKAFPDETMNFLTIGSVASLVACVAALRMDNALATPLQTTSLIFSTLAGFVWAARMPASITKVIHPLVTSSAVTLIMAQLIGLGVGSSMKDVLKTYKVGSLNPMKTGAGDLLLWALGPSVVSFAVSMYSRKQLIYENFLVIITSILVSSVGGLFATAAFARLIKLGGSSGDMARLSVLPRNVTTALAMVIASIIGGDISITAVAVVLTGVLGATYGKSMMKIMGLHDPVTRGLGMGGAAQGLGVSAMSNEPDAFPFAAIAMVLTAVASTTLVSIPAIRDAIVTLATGSSGISP